MPDKEGLKRRLKLVEEAEPTLTKIRAAAYTKALDPVKTEEGYVAVEHLLMEFSNELGLGTGNITAYGRTVYAVALAKGAESLQRAIGMHLLVRPSPDETVFRQQLTAFTSYAYLEGIAQQEYVSGGTTEDAARLTEVMKEKTEEGAQQAADAKAKAEAAGEEFTAPCGHGQDDPGDRQRAVSVEARRAGRHRQCLDGGRDAQVRGLQPGRERTHRPRGHRRR